MPRSLPGCQPLEANASQMRGCQSQVCDAGGEVCDDCLAGDRRAAEQSFRGAEKAHVTACDGVTKNGPGSRPLPAQLRASCGPGHSGAWGSLAAEDGLGRALQISNGRCGEAQGLPGRSPSI